MHHRLAVLDCLQLPIAWPLLSRMNEAISAWVAVWAIAAPDIRVGAAAAAKVGLRIIEVTPVCGVRG
jgi:hypothetical protein